MNARLKKYLRKSLKILLWIVGSVIALFLLVVILIQIPYFQNIAKDKAVTYLEGKIKTRVEIGRIEIGLPKKVIIEGVYFESQQGDTLLAGEKLAVDISLMKLLSNEVEINSIDLKGITANIKRNKDSIFNFNYIIDAFATADKPKDTTSATMKFSVEKINLDRIKIRFNDAVSKNNISANLTHFDTRIKKFDLDKMEFEVPKVNLDGFKLKLKQGIIAEVAQNTQEVVEEASSKPNLKLKLGEISLANINIGYDNEGTRLDTGIELKKLLVQVNTIDLKAQNIELERIELNGLSGRLALGKFEKQVQESLPETSPEVAKSQWKFRLNKADFDNIAFKFDDNNSVPVARGIDYKHLDITGFRLKAEDFVYNPTTIAGNIQTLTVKDKSGLDLKQLQTDFNYGQQGASLKDLYLETPQTLIKDQIVVTYPSLESISENLGALGIDANLDGSRIGFWDILLFVPALAATEPFKSNPDAIMNINSRIDGTVSNLYIANLEISGIGSTAIAASGRMTGLPDIKKAYLDLNIRQFKSTARDINMFVPKGTLPQNIQLPSNFSANATFKGTLDNFNTNLNLTSSFGGLKVKASFDQRRKNGEKYNADAQLNNFYVGRLIKNDSLGRITLNAKVKGTGLDPKTAIATVNGNLAKAEFNGYTYRDLKLNGKINRGQFEATANMNDANLDFDLVASGGFRDKYPTAKVRLNVDIADLNKLNLHAGPMKLRGNVDADITDANPDNLNGTVSLHHFMFNNGKEEFALDSVNVVAVSTPDKNSIVLKSQIANATIEGKYKLTQLGNALSNTISKYYNTNPGAKKQVTGEQQVAFTLQVNNDPVLQKLVPSIERLEPITINGRYNTVNDTLIVTGTIPRVVYGAYTISGVDMNIRTEENALKYNIEVNEVQSEQLLLSHTFLTGAVQDNIVTYRLQILDKKDEEQYLVAGQLKATNGSTEIMLDTDGLRLNYEPWAIAQNNLIRLGKNGIYADNFEMSNSGGSLKLQSQSVEPNAPLNVELDNFKIETLTNIVQKEEMKFSGTINGQAEVRNLTGIPVFVSDIDITDFAVSKDTVGNIKIKVDNEIANTYRADVAITGNGNQVNLNGNYKTDNSSFDMVLDINKFNMTSIQALTMGALKDSKGDITGGFKVTGTAADPDIKGQLDFNDVAFRVTQLNSYFKSINDNIAFTNTGIVFNNFKVEDENSNVLAINGNIATTDYKDFAFNMQVKADNFRAINSTAKDNDLYWGDLFLDTNLNIKGTLDSPVVDGKLKINKDTKFSIALPQQDPGIADREGIVEFIDQDNMEIKQRLEMDEAMNQTQVKGIDVSVAIEVDKEAELNVIIDKGNGDFLQLKGEAQLTGGIDPSGKTTLTGRYEFTEGSYQMTFNFIKRKFDIQKGSYILWTGEPTSANVNLTAVYETETAPLDLLDDQLGAASVTERNMYKQRIPFQTLLKMQGELLKPELSFDIVVPEGNYNVSSTIIDRTNTKLDQLRQQPSELNKQVFALLLLNRFIGENPFASEAGGTSTETLAKQSVSKILSQQLNNLASNLVQGVELDFDLESRDDYTTGNRENRTDLNVGLSKRLLNDRLKVTVGSNFGLEGPQNANEETTNIAGDLSADYQLTKDGRYMVRAYRKNDYQVALQGQVIETGVAFIITMDYNKFRELFHKSEEEKEMIRKEKELRERKKSEEEEEQKAQEREDAEKNKK